jgi:transposase
VFCVDEKSAIQALDRKDRRLPLSPGRAERHASSTTATALCPLFAALNPKTGSIIGQTAPRHTSKQLIEFLEQAVATCRPDQEIHIILDNLQVHKTGLVKDFLVDHPKLQLHFTPTYFSWLDQVEIWFGKLQRDVIARGIFTSVADLRRKIMRYIRLYRENSQALPVEILRSVPQDSAGVKIPHGQALVRNKSLGRGQSCARYAG